MKNGIEVRRKKPRGFAQVSYGIARDPSLTDKALRLWVVLESYADYHDRDCYPSIATLARTLCCSRTTIQRAQRELIDRGLLEIESGKETGTANVYTVVDPPGGSAPMTEGVVHP